MKGIFKAALESLAKDAKIESLAQRIAESYITFRLEYAISLFLGKYDLETGQLDYYTSGFLQPLLVNSEGRRFLRTPMNSPILADSADLHGSAESIATERIQLNVGDNLFIYTDGAVEIIDHQSQSIISERKFSKVMSVFGLSSNWKTEVLDHLKSLQGQEKFKDDITVMKLHRVQVDANPVRKLDSSLSHSL
jgi:serine phosphatase RsbU (regulator of sigma subunit)